MLGKKEPNSILIVMAGFLTFAYLLPFHHKPFAAFYNDWLAVLGIIIFAAYYTQNKLVSLRLPWIALIPLGLALVIALQTALGMLSEPWDALLPIAYLLATATAIVLGASFSAQEKGAEKLCLALAGVFLFAGIVSVLIASLQLTGAERSFAPFMMHMARPSGGGIRPFANLGQPNQLALLFCMAIASGWWLYQRRRLGSVMAVATAVILLWGLALTQSRIGWIIIPLFAIVIYSWRKQAGVRAVAPWLLFALPLFYVGVVLALPEISAALNVSTNSLSSRVAGASGRRELLEQAWRLSLAYPWFGAGWFQFGPMQVISTEFPISVYANHSHNIVLNFAAEIGWPLTIVICSVLAFWFFRICMSRQISNEAGFAILIMVAALVHSMVEYPLWYAYMLLPLALLMGVAHQQQCETRRIELPRRSLLIYILLMASAALGIGMDFRRVAAGFNEVEFEAFGISWDATATQKPAYTVFPYMYDYFRFLDMTVHPKMTPENIAFMEKVTKRFGGALSLARLSQAYAMNGREDDAVNTALTVRRLHGARYEKLYEDWRRAPAMYQNVFKRLPAPNNKEEIKPSDK